MNRPTIADLAREAGVSVSTVNRILGGGAPVRAATIQSVQLAAERIGYIGASAIAYRLRKAVPQFQFGFLLQQSNRDLYQLLGKKIVEACRGRQDEMIEPVVAFVDHLAPEHIAARLLSLGKICDAVALIVPDHPLIGQAIRSLRDAGKPVVSYITDLSAPERAAYVGTDNWKLGRTAGYLITQTTQAAGRVAVLIGSSRYQCQDVADAGFRAYIQEYTPRLAIEDSLPTHEDASMAFKTVKTLIDTTPDLVGLLVIGGGISGVLQALRQVPPARREQIRLLCRDIGPAVRKGLAEGLITAALCHPLGVLSAALVQTMSEVVAKKDAVGCIRTIVPFEIVTPENG